MPYKPHNFRALSKPKRLNKSEHKHYWPYIPLLILVASTFLMSLAQPFAHRGVLSYATSMSSNQLLSDTNQQRFSNGAGSLAINQALMTAAQTKANDMVARNYWSHTTPDGEQPWVFINNAGYKYQKAGENLAYGFMTSEGAVEGWMNSPSHRENLLDSSFSEVGFGFANGKNYNNSGESTVVVAMYGRPQVLAGNTQQSKAVPTSAAETQKANQALPVTTAAPITTEPPTQQVARVQALTSGQAPWTLFAVGLISGLAVAMLLLKHAVGIHHLLRDSERFVLHHPLLDTVLVSLVLVGSFLSQTTGFIR